MDSVEVTAKKADDALKDALVQLSATIDDVNVEVVEAGGLFRKAKLIVSLTEEVRRERERRAAREARRDGRDMRRDGHGFEKREQSDSRDFKKNEQFKKGDRGEQNNARESAGKDRQVKTENNNKNADRPQQPQPVRSQQPKPQPQPQKQQKPQPQQMQPQKVEERKAERTEADAPSEVPEKSVEAAVTFLKNVLGKMGFNDSLTPHAHGSELDITVAEEDGALIGYKGETVDALEYLTGLIANRDTEKYVRVNVDVNNYRDKRSDSVVKLAEKMAAKCIKTGHKVSLEPMNSAARKAVHAALASNDKVTTRSEGKEPNRRVVIYFKRERGAKNEADGAEKQNVPQKQDRPAQGKNGKQPEKEEKPLFEADAEVKDIKAAEPAASTAEPAPEVRETEQAKEISAVTPASELKTPESVVANDEPASESTAIAAEPKAAEAPEKETPAEEVKEQEPAVAEKGEESPEKEEKPTEAEKTEE